MQVIMQKLTITKTKILKFRPIHLSALVRDNKYSTPLKQVRQGGDLFNFASLTKQLFANLMLLVAENFAQFCKIHFSFIWTHSELRNKTKSH